MERLPGVKTIARQMQQLADASLVGSDFRRACETFGWTLEPAGYDGEWQGFMQFALPREKYLNVTFSGGQVQAAILPFYHWEDWDEAFHNSAKQFQCERAIFDRRFQEALQQSIAVLGEPQQQWTADEEFRFAKALWQGQTCLLILQQDDYDIQFGFDLNFLLQPWTGAVPDRPKLTI